MTQPEARDDLGKLIVTTREDIESLPWESSGDTPGLRHKILWRSGNVVLGIMQVDHGSENPVHTHHGAHHHILILEGECTIVGRRVGPGSYVYIPPTVPHGATEVGTGGCTFFYTYRPLERPRVAGPLDTEHAHPV